MSELPQALFPPGTPVLVRQRIDRKGRTAEVVVAGVVASWDQLPTGSWYAHGRKDKLWLNRLMLRKSDGELTLLTIDDGTAISRIEAAPATK